MSLGSKFVQLRRESVQSRPLQLHTGCVDQAVNKPCAEGVGPGAPRPAANRVFIERYQAVNRSDHAQILCIGLCISCGQSAPAPAGAGLAAVGRETARYAGPATYPLATAGTRTRRGGLCTDAVEQTVHRLFGPGCSPGCARPAGNRAKIEQNQLDRRCLCTNAVRRSVRRLWIGGARPGPAGPWPGRALFAQSRGRTGLSGSCRQALRMITDKPAPGGRIMPRQRRHSGPPCASAQGLSLPAQLPVAATRRCCSAASGGDWRLISCTSASLNS